MRYLVPDVGNTDELMVVLDRSKVPFRNPKSARELVLAMEEGPLMVLAVSEKLLLLLARHATEFFGDSELPLVIASVPGLLYQPTWASAGTAFPAVHYKQFVESVRKSGTLSTTPEEVESRGLGSLDMGTQASAMSDIHEDLAAVHSDLADADEMDH